MNYSEQLQQEEWKQKRYEILERDHFECQVCHVKRSDFLGLSFEFGIVNYTDFLILGYIVKRTGKNSESIEITKNGNKINCINLVDSISQVGLENLFFAQKWRERKNKLHP